jgi:hypothetical protein
MDTILVAHLNKFLEDNYGKVAEGNYPYFRIIWTTGLTEKRLSTFKDFYGDALIREVTEVRECLKYPFAQDRYVLERILPISDSAREVGGLRTDEKFSYEEVYTFQDRLGHYLPLTREKVEQALFLFFTFYLAKTPKERMDMRMEMLAKRELAKKEKTKEAMGEGRSPFFIGVIE